MLKIFLSLEMLIWTGVFDILLIPWGGKDHSPPQDKNQANY